MSKGFGQQIAIKFTEDLVGDISGNELAFSVNGKEFKYVNGSLIDGDYQIKTIERYPISPLWTVDFTVGNFTDTEFKNGLVLGVDTI